MDIILQQHQELFYIKYLHSVYVLLKCPTFLQIFVKNRYLLNILSIINIINSIS